ncbi:MAG: hypothetical protein A2408_00760 [Candidatus Yonathbacteria bacterium RIFOXYC1_FULL_52_10]|uniref:Type II secretion system protein J n=1 Tax=Candidatus Yonathbacteria bacterium RIFOXYD1_FULL_52_36 TaxID=1802730 RepID=A0A1G2SIH1_9BACT|nr:MAG: hypothetical protein A2408_00760 [Candidatus Yonathbacteria bacterium RIFOXYC1_FULL_52_10]OHA84836.1 MAG: hypothetical protein A2591_00700 [Candidatus Yonathbacteria bacterium RIFOXYD1_FULL_52_36]
MSMKFLRNILNKEEKGFTLVELIVSMGLFTVVIFGTTSVLLVMLDANRKAQSMRGVMEGLNFALDDVGRSVRVGKEFQCLGQSEVPPLYTTPRNTAVFKAETDAAAGCWGISIQLDYGVVTYYRLGNGIRKTLVRSDGSVEYAGLLLTPPEIVANTITFHVIGNQTGDQPRVLLRIVGIAGFGDSQSTFNIQTAVTARLPNAQ